MSRRSSHACRTRSSTITSDEAERTRPLPLAPARTLAVDRGDRRTGLAICDVLGISVRPLPPIDCIDFERTARAVIAAARNEEAARIVVGLPLNMDASEGSAARKARLFARRLEKLAAELEVYLWDERLTTVEAEEILTQAEVNKARRRRLVDSISAVVILRSFLEAQRNEIP